MDQAEQEGTGVVDVDGSYLYRKYVPLTEAGEQVSLPGHPSPPLTGWKSVTGNLPDHCSLYTSCYIRSVFLLKELLGDFMYDHSVN